ncbi:MAG: hypothetical protein L7F78_12995, partial [Syntrophales bacterium LBB04]|nr:hypothetical protein [Syntrophales bacterium LBB04]
MSPARDRAVSVLAKSLEEIFSAWAILFTLMLYVPGDAVLLVLVVKMLEAAVEVLDVVEAENALKASSVPRALAAVFRA